MITTFLTGLVASGVVTKVCTGLFGASTIITAAKNNGAKHRIERSGLIVTPDNRSASEKVISFIKDYFYLIVPGYNIYKSMKKFFTKESVYAAERLELYKDRDRIIDPKEKTVEKPAKVETLEKELEEEVVETKSTPAPKVAKKHTSTVKTEEAERTAPVTTVEPFAGLTIEQLEDLKNHYKRIDSGLRKKYTRLEASGASIEDLNKVALDTIENKKLFEMVDSRLQILKLGSMLGTSRKMTK